MYRSYTWNKSAKVELQFFLQISEKSEKKMKIINVEKILKLQPLILYVLPSFSCLDVTGLQKGS